MSSYYLHVILLSTSYNNNNKYITKIIYECQMGFLHITNLKYTELMI